ncbi:glycosyltransferase family 2 protein [uncultured Desulfovibrio sp.]|uniref:glycosyltransferase family 2 protein n=1 Tax=uncultured Desulfovibrio sp. TaxID=167968 RepID=UPI002673F4B7|nr:glycosyltransferase family 2 protein [uncultured Desulfovibrio sp.]
MDTSVDFPLVSVGIPTYNRPEGLGCILQSVVRQQYPRMEIIVSDNASSGDAGQQVLDVMAAFASDPRITFYRQPENTGAVENFRFVRKKAHGEFFIYASDDDEWLDHHLEKLMRVHMQGEYVLVASSQWHRHPDSDKLFAFLPIRKSVFTGDVKKQLRNYLRLHHWNCAKACIIYGVFRTSAMPDFMEFPGIEQEMLAVGADLLYLYEVMSRGKVYLLPEKTWIRSERFVFSPYKEMYMSIKKKMLDFIRKKELVDPGRVPEAIDLYHKHIEEIFRRAGFTEKELNKCLAYSKKQLHSLFLS